MARALSNAAKVREFLRRLGKHASGPGRVYLVGGASAVLIGWRDTTVDVDLKLAPEPAGQAIAKIGRSHAQDQFDVAAMFRHGLIAAGQLRRLFEAIETDLLRYPAIEPLSLRRKIDAALAMPPGAS